MKTFSQVEEWCDGAEQEFGDASVPIAQLFIRYVPAFCVGTDLMFTMEGCDLLLKIWPTVVPVRLRVSPNGPDLGDDGEEVLAFGAERISPGLWALIPSLSIPGLIHAFVTLYDVPNPAPWEGGLIVLAG
jgi:hypothetical protein